MQTPKFSFVLCVLALGTALSLHAQDTPAQAAARAALEAQLSQTAGQPDTNTADTNAAPMSPPPVATPPPAESAPAAAAAPAAAMTPDQEAAAQALVAAQAKAQKDAARQAAKQKRADEAAARAKARADKKAAEQKAIADQQAAAAAATAAAATSQANQQALNNKQAAAMAALAAVETDQRAIVAEAKADEVIPVQSAAPAPGVVPAAPMVVELHATPTPSLPISAEKEQRLQDLLVKYKADQITPEQYHTQRAAILAEP